MTLTLWCQFLPSHLGVIDVDDIHGLKSVISAALFTFNYNDCLYRLAGAFIPS